MDKGVQQFKPGDMWAGRIVVDMNPLPDNKINVSRDFVDVQWLNGWVEAVANPPRKRGR